jgi:uncharacterized membrane protein (UPF0127 family)
LSEPRDSAKRRLILILLSAVILSGIGILALVWFSPSNDIGLGEVTINERAIAVEIADKFDEHRRGLMFRESLPYDRGMLFIFEQPGAHSIWMMNVKFSLDVIWIDSQNVVVHVERNLPPCSAFCPSYSPRNPAKYILEVNSGVADAVGLREGDKVTVSLPI